MIVAEKITSRNELYNESAMRDGNAVKQVLHYGVVASSQESVQIVDFFFSLQLVMHQEQMVEAVPYQALP